MEKIVLSKGYEFELVPNGIATSGNDVTVTFLPGDYTVEELMGIWAGNTTMTVKIDDTSIRVLNGYTKCNNMTRITDYLICNKYYCPQCHAEVEPTATKCAECNAAFEAPTMEEVRATVCKVICNIPNINDRMSDAEDAIEDIIDTILG